MKRLKIAVIGAGFIGKQHVEAIRRVPGTEVTALADINEKMGEEMAQNLAIPAFYTNYEEMLAKEKPDAVHICTPSSLHYTMSRDVLAAGIPVFCEKPLTLKAEEAERLTAMAENAGIVTGVNFNYRNHVMVHEIKEQIRQGGIGEPVMVYGEYLQDWLLYETDYNWRMNPAAGGESRAIADIGSHCFDLAQYVLGKNITAVYAKLIRVYPFRKKPTGGTQTFEKAAGGAYETVPVENEDAAYIMAEFDGGIQGLFYVSQVCAGAKNGLKICVSGKEKSLTWEQERPDHLRIGNRDGGNEDCYAGAGYLTDYAKAFAQLPEGHPAAWTDALTNGINDFYGKIRNPGRQAVSADFLTGARIMNIIEACLQSDREQRWVKIM